MPSALIGRVWALPEAVPEAWDQSGSFSPRRAILQCIQDRLAAGDIIAVEQANFAGLAAT
jgi:hypothetical protein